MWFQTDIYKHYLHVDNGWNCTPLFLHSPMMRAFTFRQMSNTLEIKKKTWIRKKTNKHSKTEFSNGFEVSQQQSKLWYFYI